MQKRSTFQRTLLTGVLVATPLLVTIAVVRFIVGQISSAVRPLVLKLVSFTELPYGLAPQSVYIDAAVPLLSLCVATALFYGVGLVGGNVLGQQALKVFERLMMRVPLVRGIYAASRQFMDTFSKASGETFSRVVLIEYPRAGSWTIALVTNDAPQQVKQHIETSMLSVFVPTTPNPTSGFLLFVRESDVIPLTLSVDDAFKLIVSGGVLTPP